MKRLHTLKFLMCAAVAIGVAGCAQPSVKPPSVRLDVMAKQLGISTAVLQLALRSGYTTEIEGGKTLLCRHDEQTGSLVPKLQCEDPAHLQTDLQARQDFVNYLQQRTSLATQRPH